MDNTGFTKEEAIDVREDFEDLEGTKFRDDHLGLCKISAVVVAPSGHHDFLQFLRWYESAVGEDWSSFAYDGPGYDVYILFRSLEEEGGLKYIAIRDYIDTMGINYTFKF